MRTISASLLMLLFIGGCMYTDEPAPQVIYDFGQTRVRPTPAARPEALPVVPALEYSESVARDWYPPRAAEKPWRAIIVHHSATDNGDAAIFDKWHRERNHWDGVGYDFVIGNGTDSGDGEVEVTFRWRNQIAGAHCGGTAGNWANEDGIGICLVGDFNTSLPTARQMQSLLRLIGFLQRRYGIPNSRVYGHRETPGAHVTDCPGLNFSMSRLRSML